MDRMLEQMAGKLNRYDEASLSALWEKYFGIVQKYEPTEAWEEAVLILNMIQGVRWKNQLFNYHLGLTQKRPETGHVVSLLQEEKRTGNTLSSAEHGAGRKSGKVLAFRSRKPDETC